VNWSLMLISMRMGDASGGTCVVLIDGLDVGMVFGGCFLCSGVMEMLWVMIVGYGDDSE